MGSSNIVSDASGNLVERYEYTPYGGLATQELVSRPSPLVHHLYTGKELDSTGLYFYGARYYDPEIGRFISADTIVQAPYDPQSLNRYSYCRNNPINYIDPTGHSWKSFWKKVSGFVGAAVGIVLGVINPFLGMMAYSLIAASGQGGNFGKNFGINFASSLVGWGIGAGVSAAWGGGFWSGLAAAGLGGAGGGAVASAMMGGDVGRGALAGLAGGAIGYVGGFAWPLGADAVAGGVSSVIMGGEFGEGAAQGAFYNMAETVGGILAPMDTVKNQNVQPGDLAFMKADGIFGLGIALLEGGPFSHVKILTDTGNWVSALPKAGVSTFSKASYDNKQAVVLKGFRGNQSVIHAAKSLAASNPPLPYNYVLFGRGRVCSTACGSAISMGGGRQWTGIGPNSQYNTLKMYGD